MGRACLAPLGPKPFGARRPTMGMDPHNATSHAGCPPLPYLGRTSDAARRDVNVKGDETMHLSPPQNITWWIAFVLGLLGVLGYLGNVAGLSAYAFWFVLAGLVLMLVATRTRNL
jgi:hypothetical protein